MKLVILLSYLGFILNSFAAESFSFSDTLFNKQWGLRNNGQAIYKNISELERVKVEGISGNDIHWVDTSNIETAQKELIVAVIDSGIDIDHPDLKGRIWYNEKLCNNAPNAKNLGCSGFNFLDGNNNISDDMGHGTHVAGIIAANRNSIGVVGAADPRIKIMPIKVLNSKVNGFVYDGKLITDVIADSMIFAIKNGAEVVNLSLGWPKLIDTAKIRQAFQMAEEHNVIVVAASGNNSKDLPTFPCAYENVVCVGAVDNRGELSDFSNHGAKVDVVAPGEYIISTFPRILESRVLRISNYEVKRGSSQAAPFVSAAVATLKLLNPGMSNDKVRSLLFQSSRTLVKSKNNRIIKYGSLDMQNLLALAQTKEEKAFANPQLKEVTEVKFNSSDKHFKFNLALKNLSDLSYSGPVCVNSNSEAVHLEQKCFEIMDLPSHSSTILTINGSLLDLSLDSHILFDIQVDQKIFQTSLVFSRDLNADSELKTELIVGGRFEEMGLINGDRKISKMVRVIDKFHRINYPEYFYLEKLKQLPTATIVSLLTRKNGNYLVEHLSLPQVSKVLSIHRQDINLDGSVDYFVYALSAKKDELLFFNFNKNLMPLFDKYSKWSMTLSTFEGLPIDGGVERFEWVKLNHPQLENIVVPSIFKTYLMPELDNSKNILERVTSAENHQYFLNPNLQKADDSMKVELRVLDSIEAIKKMKNDFHLSSDQNIQLLKPFPQTQEQSKNGEVHSLASIDNGQQRVYYEIIFAPKKIQVKPLSSAMALDGALIFPLITSEDGEVSNESLMTSLLNRSQAEFLIKNKSGVSAPLILRQDWENPIIGLIGGFDVRAEKNILVENRSTVSFFNSLGYRFDLPVYRDSSFPGQNFSETLIPILSEKRPGVFINSSLIYGNRLYSMIGTDQGLIRPLQLSIGIPDGCVPLNPEPLERKSSFNYTFLCTSSNRETSLKFLPM